MDTKRFITGTLVGGITFFILGFLIYGLLLAGFFEANGGGATDVVKTNFDWWALILGNLASGALLTYIFLKWAHISTFISGLKAGAVLGLFVTLSFDLIMYGTSNLMNLTATVVDIVVWTIATAIAGGIIGAVLHTKAEASHAAAA